MRGKKLRAVPVTCEALCSNYEELQAKVEELTAALNDASNSFDRITELRWGYDGDCGATNIAELAIDDIRAALKTGG